MADPKFIKIKKENQVARVTLDRPKHNVLDIAMMKELNIELEKIAADPQLIVDLKIDRLAEMAKVNDVHQELRKASAIRINYSALPGD